MHTRRFVLGDCIKSPLSIAPLNELVCSVALRGKFTLISQINFLLLFNVFCSISRLIVGKNLQFAICFCKSRTSNILNEEIGYF